MKQHEIDIEALKEKHKLDMETKEKELSNSTMYSMMGDATKGLFVGIFSSPEFKAEMSKKIKEGLNKKQLVVHKTLHTTTSRKRGSY